MFRSSIRSDGAVDVMSQIVYHYLGLWTQLDLKKIVKQQKANISDFGGGNLEFQEAI